LGFATGVSRVEGELVNMTHIYSEKSSFGRGKFINLSYKRKVVLVCCKVEPSKRVKFQVI
jgi:hypothetical protein